MSEADIHFEFYRHLTNGITSQAQRGSTEYGAVRPEYSDGLSGRADLVVFDSSNEPIAVIEAKQPGEDSSRDIDPYSPAVIEQALEYGAKIGAPYCATYNGNRLVLFRTLEPGKAFLERSTKSYEITSTEKFADEFLDELARFQQQDATWDSLDDAFVNRVRSFHDYVTPRLEESLTDYLEADSEFRDSFSQWAAKQGIEYASADDDAKREVISEFSEQAAYLLINKVLFYKLLENSPAYEDEIPPLAVSIHRVQEDLEDHFDVVVSEVDFEAIFEHDDIFGEIPLDPISEKLREFIIELDDQDLTQFDSDVIGRIYEGVIPYERRREMGEYYTPPAVCDLITRLTVDSASDSVLDPACGSGGFLVSAYHRLQELLPEPAGSHSRILNQLHGIDINRFPAHLTAINLAIQDLSSYTESVNVEINDFFNIQPDTLRFSREIADAEGGGSEDGLVDSLGGLDAVVGNPPYIRSRNIDEKGRVREHLSNVDGEFISKRMDIYGYFITHSTQFLRDGGRLGVITSDRWLDTGYGADLQQFILDHYKLDAVIRFDRQTFSDALVGASVVIMTKEEDPSQRQQNVVKFLRVRESLGIDDIESLVKDDVPANQMVDDPEYRLITQSQRDLREQDKWSVHFLAPPLYFDAAGHSDVIELQDVADVNRGLTSGANDFYYARREEWEELGLTQYTTPLLKATGQLSRIRFDDEDAEEWGVLDIHKLVEQALDEVADQYADIDRTEQVKEWLGKNGHNSLVEYIEWGEDNGYHDRPTTSARDIWFDLGELERPSLLMTDFTWRIYRAVWNEASATSDAQFYNITCSDEVDEKLLGGLLNSRLSWLMVELRGRWAGGQGMTRARIKVYEAEELPLPDPSEMSAEEQQRIREAFEALMEREDALDEDERTVANTEEARDQLDRAVLATLGMSDRLDELKRAIEGLVAMRERDAGDNTEVLVTRPDEREVIELEGVSEARESTTLSDF
ncbi:N-6 DNA methylase [Salinirubellus salinus]|uniref:N-6 DNA methylase n=1 Tax=Salinirubellus salinus TaxID=1364945 RepID=A0A9E7UAE7_9EURY|nr:N-6 DNA methylase [Salinirubellus salinus]UWM53957.1 N-6 DNA methylase [Salinirubellus salinus]